MRDSVLNRALNAAGALRQNGARLTKFVMLPIVLVAISSWSLDEVTVLSSHSGLVDVVTLYRIALLILALLAGVFVAIGAVVSDDPLQQPIWVRCDEIVVIRALYLLVSCITVLTVAYVADFPLGAEVFAMLGYFVYCRRKPSKAREFAFVAFSLSVVRILMDFQFGFGNAMKAFWSVSLQWMLCAFCYVAIGLRIW